VRTARGSSSARLLPKRRGKRYKTGLAPLTEAQILAWADAHHARTGVWPTQRSGPVAEVPRETWRSVQEPCWERGMCEKRIKPGCNV